jgi:RNA recognition motif-containing protein
LKTLYIGNIPWSLTDAELISAFEQHAPIISARIITDNNTGRSKGFAFIEVSDNDAPKVIKEMNGFELKDRKLLVQEARPKHGKSRVP